MMLKQKKNTKSKMCSAIGLWKANGLANAK